jgi:N-acetylmuramic acid 6-phosphate (MurNAc-6-P) etherase
LGLVDASECPPTFGATYEDVQGFIRGGWHTMKNTEGPLTEHKISLSDVVAKRFNLLL